jgi:hypothetical protein
MTSERGRVVKGLVDEHSRLLKGRKKAKRPSVEVPGANSLRNTMRRDGVRLRDIRRGAGLAGTL